MDPFEVRLSFLSYLRRLNASQQSIQKAVGYAVKHFSSCGEDLWDCIVEECQKGSINSRINILYFLDSLCESCLLVKSHSSSGQESLYVTFVARDLAKIVELVVPQGRQGLPNLVSTKQILESWRSKRVFDPQAIDEVLSSLASRKSSAEDPTSSTTTTTAQPSSTSTPVGASATVPTTTTTSTTTTSTSRSHPTHSLPRSEIFKRIEEDRERHKRLRERRWVQPTTHKHPNLSLQLASFLPLTSTGDGEEELPIDIEFENEWEETSDWNEDDEELAAEEVELCFPAEGEGPMDLS